jgi:multidrug efflux pump subunit AcrA (membrane-fusion protein)
MTALNPRRVSGLLIGLVAAGVVAYASAGPGVPTKGLVLRVPSPRAGILLAVGTEVDKAPAGDPRVSEVRAGKHSRLYRRLVEGDKVTEGQVLAQLDDQGARDQVEHRKAKLATAREEFAAAVAMLKEAQGRLDRLDQLKARGPPLVSAQEYSGAVLTRDKYRMEEVVKEGSVKIAQLELERAQLILDLHTIRSPVSGVLQRIRKRPGEAVRKLDTLFEIRVVDSE